MGPLVRIAFATICLISALWVTDTAALHAITPSSLNPNSNFTHFDSSPVSKSDPHPRPQQGWLGKPPTAADSETWCKAFNKGQSLLWAMVLNDRDAGMEYDPPRSSAKSAWNLADLKPWGWTMREDNSDWNFESDGDWGIADLLRFKGHSDRTKSNGGLWTVATTSHEGESDDDDDDELLDTVTYVGPDDIVRRYLVASHADPLTTNQATGGYYEMGVNGAQGGVMTFARYSPAHRALDRDPPVPPEQLPALKQSSDLLWAIWQAHVPETQQHHINFFMSLSIENDETLAIIKRALDSTGQVLSRWGAKFDVQSVEGKALLGSPNAKAFAYFLINHKDTFPNRVILSIEVVEPSSEFKSPVMYFTVGDVLQLMPGTNMEVDGAIEGCCGVGTTTSALVRGNETDYMRKKAMKVRVYRSIIRDHRIQLGRKSVLGI
ncbi:hypothetical protein NX059_006614 [Plenodomus lindquistii]|nr:hypothetical protein NX059_006614 [Plenodomus lindquistii]